MRPLQHRNQIINAIENERKYSIQKRRLVELRNPTAEINMRKIPTIQHISYKSNDIDFHSILDMKMHTPVYKKSTQIIGRINTELNSHNSPNSHNSHNNSHHFIESKRKSRCNSASSSASARLRMRETKIHQIR
jgi:hypothetical protein